MPVLPRPLLLLPVLALTCALLAPAAQAGQWPDPDAVMESCTSICEKRAKPQADVGDCIQGCAQAREEYRLGIQMSVRGYTSQSCRQVVQRIQRRVKGPAPGQAMGGAFFAAEIKDKCN